MDERTRDDLDTFLSFFIRWGGWRNGRNDPPLRILWEISTDAADRGVNLSSDEIASYSEEALRRAGHSSDAAWREGREIGRTMGTILSAHHHRTSINKCLDWARSRDLLSAVEPKKAPQFLKAPKAIEFREGQIWVSICALDDDIPARFTTADVLVPHLHRLDGPAFVAFDSNGAPDDEMWCQFGRLHRADGPALVSRYADGSPRLEIWYRDGLRHRSDGPAYALYPPPTDSAGGSDLILGWARRGLEMSFSEFLATAPEAEAAHLRRDEQRYRSATEYGGSVIDSEHESVFISFGGPDHEFAQAISAALTRRGVRTFLFSEDAIPGQKLHRMMSDGIESHDRVLFICSRSSLSRAGVLNELERTLEREAREGGSDVLLPITLDGFVYGEWAPERADLARQVRSRVLLDFSGIRDSPTEFERLVTRLLVALRT